MSKAHVRTSKILILVLVQRLSIIRQNSTYKGTHYRLKVEKRTYASEKTYLENNYGMVLFLTIHVL